jgi:hypothetical protein
MKRAARLAVVGLIVALAAGPVVLDACLFACHNLSPSSTVPACHHPNASAGVHMRGPARPCSHDHHANASTMTAGDQSVRGLRATNSDTAVGIVDSKVPTKDRSFAHAVSLAQPASAARTPAGLTPLRV